MESIAAWTGWATALLVACAALVPPVTRLRLGRRAAPDSRAISMHVSVGLGASAAALVHTLTVLPNLGAPAAVGAGMAGLLPGAGAFLVIVGHVGLGLQLRRPKLKDRPARRRAHVGTALMLAVLTGVHVVALLRAG